MEANSSQSVDMELGQRKRKRSRRVQSGLINFMEANSSQSMEMELGQRKKKKSRRDQSGKKGVIDYYEKSFRLVVTTFQCIPRWYVLETSTKQNAYKSDHEIEQLVEIPASERQIHLAFNHGDHHRGESHPAPLLPLLAEFEFKKKKHSEEDKSESESEKCWPPRGIGTCHAAVGPLLFLLGGTREPGRLDKSSRKVFWFDTSHPNQDQGWRKGPRTISGRLNAATAVFDQKIYIFGGCCSGPWGEVLDVSATPWSWSPLRDTTSPSYSLGCGPNLFDSLFAYPIYQGRYKGNILVGSKRFGSMCLYHVAKKSWAVVEGSFDLTRFFTPPILVGCKIYWISYREPQLHTIDVDDQSTTSTRLADFDLCQCFDLTQQDLGNMNPKLVHLAGKFFGLLWMGRDCVSLHFTTLKVSSSLVSVVCCHHYSFEHDVCYLDCLQPSL